MTNTQREIKFRAWDVEAKKFILDYANTIYIESYGLNHLYLIAQQYSGLKDRNGVEIYEGDILKSEALKIDFVIFEEGMFKWKNEPLSLDMNEEPPTKLLPREWGEIIGNIYQNPELLEVKNG